MDCMNPRLVRAEAPIARYIQVELLLRNGGVNLDTGKTIHSDKDNIAVAWSTNGEKISTGGFETRQQAERFINRVCVPIAPALDFQILDVIR